MKRGESMSETPNSQIASTPNKKPPAKSKLVFKSITEIMNTDYPPIWQPVDGFLTEGFNVLVGDSKVGKSWLALYLAYCLASGSPFLGRKTDPCVVFYLGLEDNEARFKSRFEKMGFSERLKQGEFDNNMFFTTVAPKMGAGFESELEAAINSAGKKCFVILDVLQKVKGKKSRTQDAYEGDYEIYAPFKDIPKRTANKCAILGIHHTNKSGGGDDPFAAINGSNGLMGTADTIIMMRAENRVDRIAKITGVSRDCDIEPFTIRLNRETCIWEPTEYTPTDPISKREQIGQERYKANAAVATIRKLVTENGGRVEITYKDLLSEIGKRYGNSAYRDGRELAAKIKAFSDEMRKRDSIIVTTSETIRTKDPQTGEQKQDKGVIAYKLDDLPF